MRIVQYGEGLVIKQFETKQELSANLATIITENLESGICILPGGSSPISIYKKLCLDKTLVKEAKVLLSDDRLVPNSDDNSNYKMLQENLKISYSKGFPFSYYSLFVSGGLSLIQTKINKLLQNEIISLAVLGLGEDCHTASLFPNDKEGLFSKESVILFKKESENFERISLTFETLLKAKKIIFLITGKNKKVALDKVLNDRVDFLSLPAQNIIKNHSEIEVFVDFEI